MYFNKLRSEIRTLKAIFIVSLLGVFILPVAYAAVDATLVDSVVALRPFQADFHGPAIRVINGVVEYWHSVDSAVSWLVKVAEPCEVRVELEAAVEKSYAGSHYEIRIGDTKVSGVTGDTGGWHKFKTVEVGKLSIKKPGEYLVTIQPVSIAHVAFCNLKSIRLKGLIVERAKHTSETGGAIKVFQTAKYNGSRLSQQDSLNFREFRDRPGMKSVVIDTGKTYQTIEGFGGSFTEAAATNIYKLSSKVRKEFFDLYFDAEKGHGYTLCRTHINSCDFALGNYAYSEVDGDVGLKHFSIDRDRKALIPMIKAAQEVVGKLPIKLFASPWSPPAWMKTTGEMNNGGKLKPEYRDAWTNYYCRYIKEYEKEGIDIWGLTVQNEPEATQVWDSCLYSAEEERDFVRDHLGPALHKTGLADVKLIIWDHNRERMFDRAKVVLDDGEAAKYVWGTGFHWYGPDSFHQVKMVHDFYPEKKLIFTEGCQEGGPHLGEWGLGERYACSMINDLNNWTVGWVDWNMVLDKSGGPNHVSNLCSAPIIADVENDQLLLQSSYYYIGHFSRFIKPGAKRILCGNTSEVLLTSAFINTDGTVVVVVLNLEDTPVEYSLKFKGKEANTFSPEHSITTLLLSMEDLMAPVK